MATHPSKFNLMFFFPKTVPSETPLDSPVNYPLMVPHNIPSRSPKHPTCLWWTLKGSLPHPNSGTLLFWRASSANRKWSSAWYFCEKKWNTLMYAVYIRLRCSVKKVFELFDIVSGLFRVILSEIVCKLLWIDCVCNFLASFSRQNFTGMPGCYS